MVNKNNSNKHLRGYTLIEILIVISLIGILSIGILGVLKSLYREEKGGRTFLKSEMDVQMFLSYFKKLSSSIGFGVPVSSNSKTSAICLNNPILGYDDVNNRFCFLSTAIRQKKFSGCWWICGREKDIDSDSDSDRLWKTNATDFMGRGCPHIGNLTNDTHHNWFIYLDSTKSSYTLESNPPCDNTHFHHIAFYLGKDDNNNPHFYPDDFLAEIYMDNNTVKGCANGTFQLNLKVGNDTPQPLINCVADFRVRLIYKGAAGSSEFRGGVPIKELSGIRFCMIVQVGARRSSEEPLPNYTDCGDFTPPNPLIENEWKHFRWRVIEFNVPLYNLMLSNETA